MSIGRVAIVGDVGGHLAELIQLLVDLGMDPRTRALPPDLTVVQVGDLVHRGPHSAQVVRFVDAMLTRHPGQWVQLLGNHEQLYVGQPIFVWDEDITATAQETLRRWWGTGEMRVAAAIQDSTGAAWLATHAGLTSGFWRTIGSPADAGEAAATINALDRSPGAPLWRAGCMLGGPATAAAGPVWAAADQELLPGWCAWDAPRVAFHQVHGHSTAVDRLTGDFLGRDGYSAAATTWDPATRHTTTTTRSGTLVVGIDPGHLQAPARPWAPLVLAGARVL